MDVANELLDAIEIIVDKKIRENTAQIYFGVCKGVNGDSCVMSINGKNNTIHFYGSAPIVGLTYRVFVPNGNMSMAFAITGNDDRKGLYYSNPNLLDNWYFGNPVNQRGQTSYTGEGYTIDRWETTGTVVINNGYITASGNFIQKLPNGSALFGRTITASIFKNDTLITGTVTLSDNYSEWEATTIFDGCVIQCRADNVFAIIFSGGNLKAVKLELGDQQTLAHQDADGNWVLNEIPDYGEQLARCQRYRAERKKATGYVTYSSGGVVIISPMDGCSFPVTMRTTPACSIFAADAAKTANKVSYYSNFEVVADGTVSGVSVDSQCIYSVGLQNSSIPVGTIVEFCYETSADL